MLTSGSGIFKCTVDQAKFVAECLGIRHEITSKPKLPSEVGFPYYYGDGYDLWQDRQLGGGMCRIVHCQDIAWVTRHSGYGRSVDLTEDASALFVELGCEEQSDTYSMLNPSVYGYSNWVERPYSRMPGTMI